MHRFSRQIIIFALAIILLPVHPTSSQAAPERLPIDMMVLIDNSCSMFPANQILTSCDEYGSDPDFLRIAGANLFIARLGFGESNEADYRLGVISVGDIPELVSPLKSLSGNRDKLAGLIAEPVAHPATRIVPALQLAYQQLDDASGSVREQTPAVVLITDGIPWPREKQSNSAIEDLVAKHENTPLFIMLLQNNKVNPDYESYIKFWEELQNHYEHIFVYPLSSADEIQSTYNAILGEIQNTAPAETASVNARTPLKFFVAEYLEKVVVTIIRQSARSDTGATITDANGKVLTPLDSGVQYFKGVDNPVDVYAISSQRLEGGGRGKFWTIQSSRDVTVLVDRQGSYRINFISPKASAAGLTGDYIVPERQIPSAELRIRFNLLDENGNPVLEAQPISGVVIFSDGSEKTLAVLTGLKPDPDGIYDFGFVPSELNPAIENSPERITILIKAGTVNGAGQSSNPVTSARLQLDIGKLPFIRSISPLAVTCMPGQASALRVNIGDYATALDNSIEISLAYGETKIEFQEKEPGVYQADLQPLCDELIKAQACSSQMTYAFTLSLDAKVREDYRIDTEARELEAAVPGLECTPTSLPTSTPTLIPTATPAADSDLDGLTDVDDRCPQAWGVQSTEGCFPWSLVLSGAGILGIVMFSSTFLLSWVKVRTFAEPPDGYLIAVKDGKLELGPINLHELGRKRRSPRLAVGSDSRLAHVYLPGLKSVEFYIERSSVISYLRDPGEKKGFAFLGEEVTIVHSSDPRVVFKLSLDVNKLRL